MPTFTYENSAASNSGVILLEVPDVAWFKDSVMSAIAEMCIPENWFGDDPDYEKYAVLQANLMQATYKVLNFNPFPVGMIVTYSSDAIPPGYLDCDGAFYSITEYPELYAVIGDTYCYGGCEDGFFAVPYTKGYWIVDRQDPFVLGDSFGNTEVNIGVSNLPAHSHEDFGHTHGIQLTTDGLAVAPGELPVVVPIPIVPGTTETGYASIANTGENVPLDIRPLSMVFHNIIYAGR